MELSVADARKLLFTPCKTREHFQLWLKQFLKLDFPDCTVSEESTTNPLDAAWEYYDRIIRNDLEGYSRAMTYAGRGNFKTLSAAALETVVLLHTERNVAHMAAVDAQSQKSAQYLKEFFEMPLLKDFKVGDNARGVRIVRYTHKTTGAVLTESEFKGLSAAEKIEYSRRSNYMRIVICSLQGSQSEHVEFFVVDEIDVVPPQNVRAYRLSQNIPDPRDGMLPLTLLTSTRKSRIGLVQEEIDNAEKSGLKVKHWNLIDVTEACPTSRHKPEEPKQTYYVNDDLVQHLTKDDYEVLPDGKKPKWYPVEGFAGCRKCRLFPACKGRLATHQTSRSPMLKPITFGLGKFTENTSTPELLNTEFLCRKPDTSGLIYPRLDPELHFKTAMQMADLINGEENSVIRNKNFGKADLIALLKSKGARFAAGLDWGFVHNFVVTTIALYGKYVFVLDCFSQAGLELDDKIASADYLKTIYDNPPLYCDPEDKASTKSFRRKGYKTKDWEKFQGSVQAGIECVRSVILNAKGEIRLFFLSDDPGVAFLFKQLQNFRKKADAAGNFTEDPADVGKDEPDSLAYVIMNVVGKRGVLRGDMGSTVTEEVAQRAESRSPTSSQQQWMKDLVAEQMGTKAPTDTSSPAKTVKRGRFFFSS